MIGTAVLRSELFSIRSSAAEVVTIATIALLVMLGGGGAVSTALARILRRKLQLSDDDREHLDVALDELARHDRSVADPTAPAWAAMSTRWSAHGGDIEVRSTLDGGSTFTITLPVAA